MYSHTDRILPIQHPKHPLINIANVRSDLPYDLNMAPQNKQHTCSNILEKRLLLNNGCLALLHLVCLSLLIFTEQNDVKPVRGYRNCILSHRMVYLYQTFKQFVPRCVFIFANFVLYYWATHSNKLQAQDGQHVWNTCCA